MLMLYSASDIDAGDVDGGANDGNEYAADGPCYL
jgi:hypothetical protein